jgi:hypothetical protein
VKVKPLAGTTHFPLHHRSRIKVKFLTRDHPLLLTPPRSGTRAFGPDTDDGDGGWQPFTPPKSGTRAFGPPRESFHPLCSAGSREKPASCPPPPRCASAARRCERQRAGLAAPGDALYPARPCRLGMPGLAASCAGLYSPRRSRRRHHHGVIPRNLRHPHSAHLSPFTCHLSLVTIHPSPPRTRTRVLFCAGMIRGDVNLHQPALASFFNNAFSSSLGVLSLLQLFERSGMRRQQRKRSRAVGTGTERAGWVLKERRKRFKSGALAERYSENFAQRMFFDTLTADILWLSS